MNNMAMDETEKDLRKAFENVTTGNVNAVIEYCKTTRAMTWELMETVERQNNVIVAQNATINEFKKQLAGIQTKLFAGGT